MNSTMIGSSSVRRSIGARLGRDDFDLVGQRVQVHRAVVDARAARRASTQHRRVLHPVGVIALREILARVRAAALLAVGRRMDGRDRLQQQVLAAPASRSGRCSRSGRDPRPPTSLNEAKVLRQLLDALLPASRRCETPPHRLCMIFCISSRIAAVGREPLAWRSRSSRDSASSAPSFGSGRCVAPGLEHRGAVPRRLAAEHHQVEQRVGARADWRRAPRRRRPRRPPSAPAPRCSASPSLSVTTSPCMVQGMPPML